MPKNTKSGLLPDGYSAKGSLAEEVVVINADSTRTGVAEEYKYLAKVCGKIDVDFTVNKQIQIDHKGRKYDLIYVTMIKDGSKREFWFDITSFFGKL